VTAVLENIPRVGSFEVLCYRFDIHAHSERTRRYIARVLSVFAMTPSHDATESTDAPVSHYAVEDAGEEETVSRYRLYYNGEWIHGSGVPSHVLDRMFWHINERALEDNDDHLLIHAGAVVDQSGRAILLPADSGSGKTTVVTGLLKRGFRYLSDEAAALDPETFLIHPFAKPLSIKSGTQALFPDLRPDDDYVELADGYWHVDPGSFATAEPAPPSRVALIVCPRYIPAAKTELRSLSPAQACLRLGRQVINFDLWKRRALPILARIAGEARCYELTSSDPDEAADAVVAVAEST
jgi:hypothetical protein